MLQAKRSQLRKQIRQQKLNNIFSMKRKSLLEGKNNLMKEIYDSVDAHKDNPGLNVILELNNKLQALLELHQENQNTYIIIGNYLIYHPSNYHHFMPKLLTPHGSRNQAWCLIIIVTKLKEIMKQQKDQYQNANKTIAEILQTMTEICILVKNRMKDRTFQNSQDSIVQMYFLQLFTMQLGYQEKQEFKYRQLQLFYQIISKQLQNDQPQPQQLRIICNCIKKILFRLQNITEKEQIYEILTASMKIFALALRLLPEQREQCINSLNLLIINESQKFCIFFYTKELMQQVIYLLSQIPYLKQAIATLLIRIVLQVNVQQIILLLELGIHKSLTQCLDWSISQGNNNCLNDCLTAIYALLNKLKNSNESKILRKVIEDIEQLNFHLIIQGLAHNKQNQQIDHQLNQIIQEFYSEEDNL